MKVAFYIGRFQFRGTAIAIYDYASGLLNQKLATPIITHWPRPDERDDLGDSRGVSIWESRDCNARQMFEERFGKDAIKEYHSWKELYDILKDVDVLYILTGGSRSPGTIEGAQAEDLTHPTFDLDEMLGKLDFPKKLNNVNVVYHFVYVPPNTGVAVISQAVANRIKILEQHLNKDRLSGAGGAVVSLDASQVEIVPHILREWPNIESPILQHIRMRQYLGIPWNATVFGRLGGVDTFNIQPVMQAIKRCLNVRKDVYFLFCTAPMDVLHPLELNSDPRVLFIAPVCDDNKRSALIDACDYMLHASQKGESFGLSILEFLSRGRPILTFEPRVSEVERLQKLEKEWNSIKSIQLEVTPEFKTKIENELLWLGYHHAVLPNAFYADQHLRHLTVLEQTKEFSDLYKKYWDDNSLDALLQSLKVLDVHKAGVVKPIRFQMYMESEVMKQFDRVFLQPFRSVVKQ